MAPKSDPKDVVLSYIAALDGQNYSTARNYLDDEVRVRGPAGEAFRKPAEFIEMLSSYRGKYDIKKVFVDGDDVCVLYDLITQSATVFMCSWYIVRDEKIAAVHTVFDPRPFGPPRQA